MKKLQQQVMMLHMQQQQQDDKVEELQAEVERVIGIIQPINQKLHWEVEEKRLVPLEHLSFDLVEKLQKEEEDLR